MVVESPELRLACAVVEQAVKDAQSPNVALVIRQDAADYLCRRMWVRGDVWGDVVREFLPFSAREELLKISGVVKVGRR
jgi:hypothetical protein